MNHFMQRLGFGRKSSADEAREELRREIEEAEREGRQLGTISADEHRSRMNRFFEGLRAQVAQGRLKP